MSSVYLLSNIKSNDIGLPAQREVQRLYDIVGSLKLATCFVFLCNII